MSDITASTTLICDGFTAAGFLDNTKLSLTSYSASHHKTLMQSNAVWNHAISLNAFRRTKGPYIQDVPTISCEISFEPDITLLKNIINKVIDTRNAIFTAGITDSASGINWIFSECYIQNFSFNVSMNSILSASASFFVVPEQLGYAWNNRTNPKYGSDKILPLKTPIPYYAWKISDPSGEITDISEFSFSFNQTITPKYSCCGCSEKTAPSTTHLLFGIPTIEFEMTRLIVKGGGFSIYEDSSTDVTLHKDKTTLETNKLLLSIGDTNIFELTGLTEIEKTPVFEGVPAIRTTYSVNGILKKSEDNSDSSNSQ